MVWLLQLQQFNSLEMVSPPQPQLTALTPRSLDFALMMKSNQLKTVSKPQRTLFSLLIQTLNALGKIKNLNKRNPSKKNQLNNERDQLWASFTNSSIEI